MNQKQVQTAVTNYLPKLGFNATKLRSTNDHGYNFFRATHERYTRTFFIETVGDVTKSTTNTSFKRETNFYQALGQIMTKYRKTSGYYYGLAFPDTYKQFIFRNIDATLLKQFNLNFFFVSRTGRVEYVTYKTFAKFARKAA